MKNFKIIASVSILFVMSNVYLNASDKSKKLSVQDQRVVDGLRSTIKVASKKADLLISQKKEIPAALAKEYQMAMSSLDAMGKKTGTPIDAGIKGTRINEKLVEKANTLPAIPEKTETMPKSTGTGTKPPTNVDQAPTGTTVTVPKNLTAAQKALIEKATKALELIKADNNSHVVGAMAIWVRDDNLTDKSTVEGHLTKAKEQMPLLEADLKKIGQANGNLNQAVRDLSSMLEKDKNNDALKAAVAQVEAIQDQAIPLVTDFESKVSEAKGYIRILENKANEYKTTGTTAPTGTAVTAPTVTTETAPKKQTVLSANQEQKLNRLTPLRKNILDTYEAIKTAKDNLPNIISDIKALTPQTVAINAIGTYQQDKIQPLVIQMIKAKATLTELQNQTAALNSELSSANITEDLKSNTLKKLNKAKEDTSNLCETAALLLNGMDKDIKAALTDINARPSGTTATAPTVTTGTAPKDLTAEEKTLLTYILERFDNIESGSQDDLYRVDDIKKLANIDLANSILVQTNYTIAKNHIEQLNDNLRHLKNWKTEIDQAIGKLLPLLKQGEQTDAKKVAQDKIKAALQGVPVFIANFESGTTEAAKYYKKLEDKFNANKTAGAATAPTGTTDTAPTGTASTAPAGLTDAQKDTLSEIEQLAQKIKLFHQAINTASKNLPAKMNEIKALPSKSAALAALATYKNDTVQPLALKKLEIVPPYMALRDKIGTLTAGLSGVTYGLSGATIPANIKADVLKKLETTRKGVTELFDNIDDLLNKMGHDIELTRDEISARP